jgi:predicted molibdopterin-dependent oxidoreductase YjgC
MPDVEIDGHPVTVEPGATLLDACRTSGVDVPTLCFGETLHPKNACRICMVELEGSRVLVPACSRLAEDGMVVHTSTERTAHARKLVLELLASTTELDWAPHVASWIDEYGAAPGRFGADAATVHQPATVDNDLYVRDYGRCILCYKCVDACGEQWQNTFAISVAGRGFDARISAEWDAALPDSACVYCGNCIAVCPTGALTPTTEFEMRQAGTWDEDDQTVTTTVCGYCGVGCNLELHVQDNRIVKVTSPEDHSITHGNLCIKGRFGFTHVEGPSRRRDR